MFIFVSIYLHAECTRSVVQFTYSTRHMKMNKTSWTSSTFSAMMKRTMAARFAMKPILNHCIDKGSRNKKVPPCVVKPLRGVGEVKAGH